MRYLFHTVCLLASFVALSSLSYRTAHSSERQSATDATNPHPVIVELFTSEGCSSCPPADALLAELEARQPIPGVRVIALEEHVDYWDQQGWRDPFSSEQWTERQQRYATVLRDGGVYTPQMIIEGRAQFVGSREREARQQIQQAASQAGAQVSLVAENSPKHEAAQFKVSVGPLSELSKGDSAEVWLAVTETGLHSAVTRGENAGHELHHAAVVRSLHKIGSADRGKDPSFTGEPVIKLDHAWNRQNLRVVVFVQENHSRHILGSAVAPTS